MVGITFVLLVYGFIIHSMLVLIHNELKELNRKGEKKLW